jgi:hypothetical protein
MDIDSLEAGPVLDAMIMGEVFNEPAFPHGYTTSPYSTDIAFAWEVVLKLVVRLERTQSGWCAVAVDMTKPPFRPWEAYAPHAPLAICRAALKAASHG